MSFHRLVALVSATALLGLFGAVASASNNYPIMKKTTKAQVKADLRQKVQNAAIDGCG